MEIFEAYDLTGTVWSAAALTGHDPKTVKRYVEARASGRNPFEREPRPKMIDAFLEKIGQVRAGHFTQRTMHRFRTSRSISNSRIRLFFSLISRRSHSSSARSDSRIRSTCALGRPVRRRRPVAAPARDPAMQRARGGHRALRRPQGPASPSRLRCVSPLTELGIILLLLGPHESQPPLQSRTPRYGGRGRPWRARCVERRTAGAARGPENGPGAIPGPRSGPTQRSVHAE